MARVGTHNVADNWIGELVTTIDDSENSIVFTGAGASGEPTAPFKFTIDAEVFRCTVVAVDTPTAGRDTLTCPVRGGFDGTSASAHTALAVIEQPALASQIQELNNKMEAIEWLMAKMLGDNEGVQRTDSGTNLKVVAQSSPDMSLKYKAGAGIVSLQPVALVVDTDSANFFAPVGNPRIDTVQIDQEGTVSVKTGSEAGSPSAPAVDSANLLLAWVHYVVGQVHIDNADGGDGWIEDKRVFI